MNGLGYNDITSMIKAVFFDLYYTLVCYDPPPEEIQSRVLQELGINIKPEALRRPLFVANEFIYNELARIPLTKRSPEGRAALFAQYQGIMLKEAGIAASKQLITALLGKAQQVKSKLVLYADVMPVLKDLKSRGLMLGLISNMDSDVTPILADLGLDAVLQIVVTSREVGYSKPQPEIFQAALRQGGVPASVAAYIGDQYSIDMLGAKNAAIKGILLDRGNFQEAVSDFPRIQDLTQLTPYLA